MGGGRKNLTQTSLGMKNVWLVGLTSTCDAESGKAPNVLTDADLSSFDQVLIKTVGLQQQIYFLLKWKFTL